MWTHIAHPKYDANSLSIPYGYMVTTEGLYKSASGVNGKLSTELLAGFNDARLSKIIMANYSHNVTLTKVRRLGVITTSPFLLYRTFQVAAYLPGSTFMLAAQSTLDQHQNNAPIVCYRHPLSLDRSISHQGTSLRKVTFSHPPIPITYWLYSSDT